MFDPSLPIFQGHSWSVEPTRINCLPFSTDHTRLVLVLSSSSSQNPAESSAHNASVPDELWAQRDQPALEDIK